MTGAALPGRRSDAGTPAAAGSGAGFLLAGAGLFVASRLLQAAGLVLAVITINFVLVKAAPGDPAARFIPLSAPPSYAAHVREVLGLNRPLPAQFLEYARGVAHLDLGLSLQYRVPVVDLIWSRLGATLLLTVTGLALSSVAGVLLGVLASRAGRWTDLAATLGSLTGYSMPVFWLGQLLLLLFALDLRLLPAQGMTSFVEDYQGLALVADTARHLALPALTYAVFPLALIFRLTRARMREVWSMDFIVTARAKGVRRRGVLFRHALPNAFPPVLTAIGYNVGFLFVGAVLVETVFAWPGMGQLLANAVVGRDYPLLLGIFTVTSVTVIAANTATDLLCVLLDPRLKDGQLRSAGRWAARLGRAGGAGRGA